MLLLLLLGYFFFVYNEPYPFMCVILFYIIFNLYSTKPTAKADVGFGWVLFLLLHNYTQCDYVCSLYIYLYICGIIGGSKGGVRMGISKDRSRFEFVLLTHYWLELQIDWNLSNTNNSKLYFIDMKKKKKSYIQFA